jgi:hypothetical protein
MHNILTYLQAHPASWLAIGLMVAALLNHRHAEKQQDVAFNMPQETDTDRICRHISLLETRVWVQSWWIIAAISVILFFI